MRNHKTAAFWVFGLFCLGIMSAPMSMVPMGLAAEPPADWRAMSQRVDERLRQRAADEGVEEAAGSSDAEFLRRVSLDLTGQIPRVSQVRAFLSDEAPDRRQRQIESLLSSPRFASHLAATWRRILLPEGADARQAAGLVTLEDWLRERFADNVSYNQLVAQLLLAEGNVAANPATVYYSVLQAKPEALAANTSRALLGVQIQCAECHDHPFDQWTRGDFWGLAAFFARLGQPANRNQFVAMISDTQVGEVMLPGTDQPVPPRFLDGVEPADEETGRRRQLADWMTRPQNPFLAQATVNRVWAHLFGRGLVDPVDDLGPHNPASHPELLDELADYFVRSQFDVRGLFQLLVSTRAYQLSSADASSRNEVGGAGAGGDEARGVEVGGDEAGGDELQLRLFQRMAIKSLTGEQLYDCLQTALILPTDGIVAGGGAFNNRAFNSDRQAFLSRFAEGVREPTGFHAGIPQALTLMNGSLVTSQTDVTRGHLLRALQAPFYENDRQRIETLFLATLSRFPSADEADECVAHLDRATDDSQREQGLADMLWAVLNSAEFSLNH